MGGGYKELVITYLGREERRKTQSWDPRPTGLVCHYPTRGGGGEVRGEGGGYKELVITYLGRAERRKTQSWDLRQHTGPLGVL